MQLLLPLDKPSQHKKFNLIIGEYDLVDLHHKPNKRLLKTPDFFVAFQIDQAMPTFINFGKEFQTPNSDPCI